MSGLIADAKTLIDKARVETQVKLASYLLFTLMLEFLVMPSCLGCIAGVCVNTGCSF